MDECRWVVCGIAGSLRAGSYNRELLVAARELAPEGMQIRIFERLGDLPPYNADVELMGLPEPVAALHSAIREADGLLIATPEYAHGVPGLLKNAIDWASRPPATSPLHGRPAALMGATSGVSGTARAQSMLRESFVYSNTPALLQPEVLVAHAHEKFDDDGRLTDEATRKDLRRLLAAFADWIDRVRSAP